jgi:Zn-dependent protease
MEDHLAPPPAAAPAAPEPARPRRSGIRLGRVAGVPVVLTYAWLFLGALITFTYGRFVQLRHPDLSASVAYLFGLFMVLFLLGSVLLHELGHALVARRFGIGVRGITLELLGGYTEMDRDAPSPKVELLVALAGPAVSGVLGIAAVLFQLAFSNVVVALFNALPGLPLDGGRALRAGIWAASGNRNVADRVAGWTGRVVAGISIAGAVALFLSQILTLFGLVITLMVAVSLWSGATQAIRMGQIGQQLPLVNAGRLARPLFPVATGTPLAEAERQLAEAQRQVAAAQSGSAPVPEAVLAVVDSGGRLLGVVNGEAAAAVPAERRPWVTIDAVARTLQPNQVLPAELSGMDVIRAVQANPAAEYVVTTGEDVIGVLRVADLMNVLEARGHA